MNKFRALNLGMLAVATLICGAVISVLMHFLYMTLVEQYNETHTNDDLTFTCNTLRSPFFWIIGLFYAVPAFFGLLSALVQKKILYIPTAIMGIIGMLVMVAAVVVGVMELSFFYIGKLAITRPCKDTNFGCTCVLSVSDEETLLTTPFQECSGFHTFGHLINAVVGMAMLGWLFLLFVCSLCIFYSCTPEQRVSITSPDQQPMVLAESGKPGKKK